MRDLFIIGRRFYCWSLSRPVSCRLSHSWDSLHIESREREGKSHQTHTPESVRSVHSVHIRVREPVARRIHREPEKVYFLGCCVCCLRREEEARKAVEAISEENIVPYKIAVSIYP